MDTPPHTQKKDHMQSPRGQESLKVLEALGPQGGCGVTGYHHNFTVIKVQCTNTHTCPLTHSQPQFRTNARAHNEAVQAEGWFSTDLSADLKPRNRDNVVRNQFRSP